jgi:AcrR family transcriptional regulator
LIARRGYAATTLRDIADEAGVSVGLLYRYFPSKQAVALTLCDELSARYAARAEAMPEGTVWDRARFAVEASLAVLETRRATLRDLLPVLVGGSENGLFAPRTRLSRVRVARVFDLAVRGASDAPDDETAEALGRLLYLLHLLVILWWLLEPAPARHSRPARAPGERPARGRDCTPALRGS